MRRSTLTYILFTIVFLLLYCKQESRQLTLEGTLNDKLSGKFIVKQQGEAVSGYFFFMNDENTKIKLRGILSGQNLRLEEFNGKQGEITGIFDGIFDGSMYEGYWTNPDNSINVSFSFRAQKEETINPEPYKDTILAFIPSLEANTSGKIKYITYDYSEYPDEFFDHGLKAVIGSKQYRIIPFDGSEVTSEYENCFNLLDVRDFNEDGYEEALIKFTGACGGWAVPTSELKFCTYDSKRDEFIFTNEFGAIVDDPIIEKFNGKWSVKLLSVDLMFRASERYILSGTKEVRVEYYNAPQKLDSDSTKNKVYKFALYIV